MNRISLLPALGLAGLLLLTSGAASAEEGYFDSAGSRLWYVDEGGGEPVLLIHGLFWNVQREFIDTGLLSTLRARGYRVIAFDQRGHGRSDFPTDINQYGENLAHDVRRVLDYVEADQAHILGYSLGGRVATKFGELYPDRASSLILGGIGFPFWAPDPVTVDEMAKFNEQWGFGEDNLDPNALTALFASLRSLPPDESVVRRMDIPTLVVAGENDSRADGAKTLAGMMPDAKFVSLPGGHDEAPLTPEYLESILEFLDKT